MKWIKDLFNKKKKDNTLTIPITVKDPSKSDKTIVQINLMSCYHMIESAINKNYKTVKIPMDGRLSEKEMTKIAIEVMSKNKYIKSYWFKTIRSLEKAPRTYLVFSFNVDADGHYFQRIIKREG